MRLTVCSMNVGSKNNSAHPFDWKPAGQQQQQGIIECTPRAYAGAYSIQQIRYRVYCYCYYLLGTISVFSCMCSGKRKQKPQVRKASRRVRPSPSANLHCFSHETHAGLALQHISRETGELRRSELPSDPSSRHEMRHNNALSGGSTLPGTACSSTTVFL